eukprot:Clim_evm20s221 gene=Clim_evmTU20s221
MGSPVQRGRSLVDECQAELRTAISQATQTVQKFKGGPDFLRQLEFVEDDFRNRLSDLRAAQHNEEMNKSLKAFVSTLRSLQEFYVQLKTARMFAGTRFGQRGKSYSKSVEQGFSKILTALALWKVESSNVAVKEAITNTKRLAVATGFSDLEISTEQDAKLAYFEGTKLMYGHGVPKAMEQAFQNFRGAAQYGYPPACNMLGYVYENGHGTPQDLPAAVFWYEQASLSGDSEAMNNLGRLYEMGKAIDQDLRRAADYYTRAAELQHPDAQNNLGYMYEKGLVTGRQEHAQAVHWYRLAANQGYAKAMNNLGSLYYSGSGVEQDYETAAMLFQQGAAVGHAPSQNNLGICYEEGKGVPRDLVLAKTMYANAAAQDYPSAINNLGYIHLLEKDYDTADMLFRLASAKGSLDAFYNIGNMYEEGVVIEGKQINIAYRFFMRAAEAGYTKAQIKVAEMIMNKQIPKESLASGMHWLQIAADSGDPEAKYRLAKVLHDTHEEINFASAHRYAMEAAQAGHAAAMYLLGIMFEAGQGVLPDHEMAMDYLQEAERQGHREAGLYLREMNQY